jgi:Family of unknown function (DUF6636)
LRRLLFSVLAFSLAAAAASAGASVGASTAIATFKTPSKNSVCLYVSGGGQKPAIECGIKSKLKPRPSRHGPGCNHLDYVGDRVDLNATGKAKPVSCAGDAGPFAYLNKARVLGYGKTWHKGPIWCSSHPSGLVCTNPQSHGFFLSRARWVGF